MFGDGGGCGLGQLSRIVATGLSLSLSPSAWRALIARQVPRVAGAQFVTQFSSGVSFEHIHCLGPIYPRDKRERERAPARDHLRRFW